MQINGLVVTNNNSSKAKGGTRCQKPTIRVKRDGVLIARVEIDPNIRASSPLKFISTLHYVCDHAKAKRQELIDKLTAVGIEQATIDEILQATIKKG